MLKREQEQREQVEIFCIEEFVPKDHLLRKIDRAVDFTHIYDIVKELYSTDCGRPSIDPVVLFKMVLIQHLYAIPSLRKTAQEVRFNVAYRWFLGYPMNETTPHFSTISYNFKHRFGEQTIDDIFYWILNEIESAGYLDAEAVFLDATHIKANANIKKVIKKEIAQAARTYTAQLLEEVNEDREKHGKDPFDGDDNPPKEKTVNTSQTDPDSGIFHKGEHKKCFAYEAHTACDRHGYIMEAMVTAGNVHDSVAFDELYAKLIRMYPEIQTIVADAGYKTPWICKQVMDDKRALSLPYTRAKGKKDLFKPADFVYDSYYDCVICPNNQILHYATTNREGYREFKSNPDLCENCTELNKCTHNKQHRKIVAKHIWADYLEQAEDYRYMRKYKQLYELRKEIIERVFADAKEKYAMRYTLYTGLSRVSGWVRLKYAAMNLKKLAIHKWNDEYPHRFFIAGLKFILGKYKTPNFCFAA